MLAQMGHSLALIVFTIDDRESDEIGRADVMLVGSKVDLEFQRVISGKEGMQKASEIQGS
jgi:hypothetical protein